MKTETAKYRIYTRIAQIYSKVVWSRDSVLVKSQGPKLNSFGLVLVLKSWACQI